MSYVAISIVATLLFLLASAVFAYLYFKDRSVSSYLAGAFIFATLALIMFWGAWGLSLNEYREAPCENVINSTTSNGNTTSYTYTDSCADREVNGLMEGWFVVLTWSVYLAFVTGVFGPVVLLIKWVMRKL